MIPEFVATITDEETTWKIGIIGRFEYDEKAGILTLPDPDGDPEFPDEPIVLDAQAVIQFAQEGMCGLRVISESKAEGAKQEVEHSRQDGGLQH